MKEFLKPTLLKLFLSFLLTFFLTFYVYVYNGLLVDRLTAKAQTSTLPPCPTHYSGPGYPICRYSEIKPITTEDTVVFIICILLSFVFFYYFVCMLTLLMHQLNKQKLSMKRKPVRR
jgi:hypothetical protein